MARTWVLRAVAGIVLLAVLLLGGAWLYARSSLPKLAGTQAVPGIGLPVEILRDRNGVPHIFAQSRADAYFGLGYAHAQDRLWQMELNRRFAQGRLSTLFGREQIDRDRFMRVIGFYRLAERRVARLTGESAFALNAYTAGVNAVIDAPGGALPPEFLLLRHAPERWVPADSVVWLAVMALDLGGNMGAEILRLRLADRLSEAQLRQLFADTPDIAGGSNNWVVAGRRTATGKPLLANDPHLRLGTPSVWYLAHLSWPGQDIIGATLAGVPAVILGRNRRIAWGFTNTGPDVQDLYLEKLDPTDDNRYMTPAGPAAFTTRREVIEVKDGAPVELLARATRHGPVVSDVMRRAAEATPKGHVLALAWTALAEDDETAEAGAPLSEAENWPTFRAALSHFHAPTQNVVYADVDGNIGFQVAGRVPIRKPENAVKGVRPVPGWEAKYDWDGLIPFDKLPMSFNPASGALATANHKIVPDDYPYFMTSEWAEPYRIRRIHELLGAQDRHTIDSFRRMQADVTSLMAREFLPIMLAALPDNEHGRAARRLLERWDGTMARDRPEPLLFLGWYREITRGLYADELGDRFEEAWAQRPLFVHAALSGNGSWGEWCADKTAGRPKTCRDIIAEALDRAWGELENRHGADPALWRWGKAHVAALKHIPFTRAPVLHRLFDLRVATGGDTYTVNVGHMDFRDGYSPFANIHAAGYRAIYDLDDLDRSLFVLSTGQSGNPLSPLYGNLLKPWSEVDYIPMSVRRKDAEAGALGLLKLTPR